MNHKALVVIDIQNDITRHYRDIIDRLNAAIEWAAESGMEIVYIQHNNLSATTCPPVRAPSSRAQKERNLCRSSRLSRITFLLRQRPTL